MANTHRAVIEHLDNTVTMIAAGPQDFCEKRLFEWIGTHPLGEFDTPLILAVSFPNRPAHSQTIEYINRLLTINIK